MPEDIEVQCRGKLMAPRLALLLGERPAMQGGFAGLPRNMANAISEAFELAKADLEIS